MCRMCTSCADMCAKMSGDAQMMMCADACRKAAAACRAMMAAG